MSWYKTAKDFSNRNIVNGKIIYLENVKVTLSHVAKLVFQTATTAKETNYKIISSSKIGSYPSLHEILIQADELALDSPWKFAALCEKGIGKADKLIAGLKKEREEITYGKAYRPRKGWVLENE